MPTYYTEFGNIGDATVALPQPNDGRGNVPVAKDAKASGSITSSGSNQQSSAFNIATKFVRVTTTVDVKIAFGDDPNATSGTVIVMLANSLDYFGVEPLQKISVVSL